MACQQVGLPKFDVFLHLLASFDRPSVLCISSMHHRISTDTGSTGIVDGHLELILQNRYEVVEVGMFAHELTQTVESS